MIRRNAQKGIQIARKGYLSFIEKGNIGVVNYTQTGMNTLGIYKRMGPSVQAYDC